MKMEYGLPCRFPIVLYQIDGIPPDFAFLWLVVAQGEAEVNGRKLSLKI